jgi:hypothetical protein
MASSTSRLKAVSFILILVAFAGTFITGLMGAEGVEGGGGGAELGEASGVHIGFAVATVLLVLGHMAINYRSALFCLRSLFAFESNK